jgi:hypothetical protein
MDHRTCRITLPTRARSARADHRRHHPAHQRVGYTHTAAAPKSNGIASGNGGEALWKFHLDNIRHGRALHDSVRELAAMLVKTGMQSGAAVHLLAALLELSETSHDARWEARYREVPRAVDSAVEKYR